MAVKSVNDLLMDELQDIYHAEKQLVKALPKMAKKRNPTSCARRSSIISSRPRATYSGSSRCSRSDAKPRAKRCEAMEGLIEEAEELMGEIATPKSSTPP